MSVVGTKPHAAMPDLSPLPAEERKSDFGVGRSEFDPKATFGPPSRLLVSGAKIISA